MEWYNYVYGFLAGMFLANFVPHFVKGVCGDRFPTPFAKPPGRGLSSPTVNVIWGLLNVVAGYLLFRCAKVSADNTLSLLILFAGVAFISIPMSRGFAQKHKE
jgi:hypothetical protein